MQALSKRASDDRSSTADFVSQPDSRNSSVDTRVRLYKARSKEARNGEWFLPGPFSDPFHNTFAGHQLAPWGHQLLLPPQPLSYGYTYAQSAAASSTRFTKVTGRNEPGCVVSCIAMVTGVGYTEARRKTAAIADFDGSKGVAMSDAKQVLDALGTSSTLRTQNGNWESLPDYAIISVRGTSSPYHAVVFKRKNGVAYIYDWHNFGKVRLSDHNYHLNDNRAYLEINR